MAQGTRYSFSAPLWEWESRDNWFFVSLPRDVSDEIAELPFPPRGFGSIPVRVVIGESQWSTSIFPGANGLYSLPIRRQVREKNGIAKNDTVEVELVLAD